MLSAKSKLKNIFWTVFAFILLFPVNVVFAGKYPTECNKESELCNPLNIGTIKEFLKLILDVVITIATPIVILMIVYSGFLFVKAQGNPEELAKAKKAILWTLIGAIIVLGAFVISAAIQNTVDDLTKPLPPITA